MTRVRAVRVPVLLRRLLPVLTAGLVGLASVAAHVSSASAGDPETSRLLIVGDSITQGSSGDYTWRFRLWQHLGPEVTMVGPRHDVWDRLSEAPGSQDYAIAFPGDAHGARWGGSLRMDGPTITEMVEASSPDVLVTDYGSNDLHYVSSPARAIEDLRAHLAAARTARPGLDVVVGEVVTRWDYFTDRLLLVAESAQYNRLLHDLAAELDTPQERVVVADLSVGWDPRRHTQDGTHPNPTGESLIAQRTAEALLNLGIGPPDPEIIAELAWEVPGPPIGVGIGQEAVDLSWSRVRTGADSVLLESRRLRPADPEHPGWERLPYAVRGGDQWRLESLIAGGRYRFRAVPVKALMTGVAGPPSPTALIRALPFGSVTSVDVVRVAGRRVRVRWPAASEATGYRVSVQLLGRRWQQLEEVARTGYRFGGLVRHGRYRFAIRPMRDLVPGRRTVSRVVRLP